MSLTVDFKSEPIPNPAVLLIDEDPEQLECIARIIQEAGYRVQACNSYTEGMQRLVSGVFDLVVVGQGSPNFEGRCVLECTSKFNRRLPVITVARHLEMPCYLDAMQLGAVDYLAGPLSSDEMARTMRTLAPRRKGGDDVQKPNSSSIAAKPMAA